MRAGIAGVFTPPFPYREKAEKASRTRHPHAHAHTHMEPPPYRKHPQYPHAQRFWGPLQGAARKGAQRLVFWVGSTPPNQ